MNINQIVKNIYNKLGNIKYTIGDWFIIDDIQYKKIKNKVTLYSINNINVNAHNEITCLLESKNKFYFIKWNHRFISIIESETEYGLAINDITIFAINSLALEGKDSTNKYKLKDILDTIGFKLSKKIKKDLEYFT